MRKTVLIADEERLGSELLKQIFQNDYDILVVEDGKQTLQTVLQKENEIALIFLDWNLPLMSGYQVLQILQSKEITERIPIMITTAKEEGQIELMAYSMGAMAVLKKPYAAAVVRKRAVRMIELYAHMGKLQDTVLEQEKELKEKHSQLNIFYEKLLDGISTIVEYRSPESERHVKRVKGFTKIMAEVYKTLYPEAELSKEQIEILVRASAIHDIGKIAIPDSILLKPAKLTEEERQVMMSHTTRGCEVLSLLADIQEEEQYKVSYEVCRYHHERHDGKGYPDGLVGDEIPLSARIVSLTDVYDSLVSERIYKKPYDKDTAYHMIMNGECGSFSPDILHCFEKARKLLEHFSDSN